MRMKRTLLVMSILAGAACGGDGGGAKPAKPAAKQPAASGGVKPAGASSKKKTTAKKAKVEELKVYAKVDDRFRVTFTKENFTEDPEGHRNRDPFRSYLVQPVTIPTAPVGMVEEKDPCEERNSRGALVRWRAPQFGMRDLRLAGIIKKGNKGYAMFVDARRYGHFVYRGDCLSKEKVQVTEIGDSCVTLKIQPEAPPGGGPAPPPYEDSKCVNTSEPPPIEGGEESGEESQ